MDTKSKKEVKPTKDIASKEEPAATDYKLEMHSLATLPASRQTEAFKLATDAQAQRRNLSNNVVYRSPLFLSTFVLLVSFVVYQLRLRAVRNGLVMEWGTLMLSVSGIAMALFSVVSRYTENIITKAEQMDYDEVFGPDVEVYAMTYKVAVVGVCAVRRPGSDRQGKALLDKFEKQKQQKRAKMDEDEREEDDKFEAAKTKVLPKLNDNSAALVTAWSVIRRYRKVGLGTDLLGKVEEVAAKEFKAKKMVVFTETIEIPANAVLKKRGYKRVKSVKVQGMRGKWFGIEEITWEKELK